MLTSLRVTGFRNFPSLSMEGLTRVNLLVGENNAGKTSVLEALEVLLLARTQPLALARGPTRRGESVPPLQIDEESDTSSVIDLRHLFHGRELSSGSRFEAHGQTSRGEVSIVCTVEGNEPVRNQMDLTVEQDEARVPLRIVLVAEPASRTIRLPLEISRFDLVRRARILSSKEVEPQTPALQFIGTTAPPTESLGALWDGIVLTPEEDKVIAALRIIQPNIERIASLSQSRRSSGGIYVKLQHSDRRVPLGSMGEGIKRLLVLAMNLVQSAGGYLLVDEIDTGLHYSVMVKMWELVVETARRLDIQVFATTHSLDCIQALAGLYEREPDVREDISLHRIEKGAEASIRYSADEILSAAQRQVEMR